MPCGGLSCAVHFQYADAPWPGHHHKNNLSGCSALPAVPMVYAAAVCGFRNVRQILFAESFGPGLPKSQNHQAFDTLHSWPVGFRLGSGICQYENWRRIRRDGSCSGADPVSHYVLVWQRCAVVCADAVAVFHGAAFDSQVGKGPPVESGRENEPSGAPAAHNCRLGRIPDSQYPDYCGLSLWHLRSGLLPGLSEHGVR